MDIGDEKYCVGINFDSAYIKLVDIKNNQVRLLENPLSHKKTQYENLFYLYRTAVEYRDKNRLAGDSISKFVFYSCYIHSRGKQIQLCQVVHRY